MVRCEGNRLYGRVDESCVARGRRSTKGETDKRTSTKAQKKNRYALKTTRGRGWAVGCPQAATAAEGRGTEHRHVCGV